MSPRTLAVLLATPLLAVAPAFASSLRQSEMGRIERRPFVSTAFLWTGGDGLRDQGCESLETRLIPLATTLAPLGCSSLGVGFEAESPAAGRRSAEGLVASGPHFALVDHAASADHAAPDVVWAPDVGVGSRVDPLPTGHDAVSAIPEPSAVVVFSLGVALALTRLRSRAQRN